ncbi:MAG: AlkZ family DNA glycosylase [Anaerolineae bacterium]|nr:AlkZ family DNA glycosylase [Anaerolineae bacterium]
MPNIAIKRLHTQRLQGEKFASPEDAVAALGAVQAQEYLGAKWALGLRVDGATDAGMSRAIDDGRLVRTHIMRPTWHLVSPEDLRWIMRLTAPRVHKLAAYMNRQLELDSAQLARCNDVIARALDGGRHLTRKQLRTRLDEAGIATGGLRMGIIMMHAELELVVCNGTMEGKQHTYALVDERVPAGRDLEGDEALAELVRRYFSGHGPATLRDFAWWSGLTMADAKAGIALAEAQLERVEVDGQTHWFSPMRAAAPEHALTAHLLPLFDEYFVGYAEFGKAVSAGQDVEQGYTLDAPVVIAGEIVARWRSTIKKGAATVHITPQRPLSADERAAIDAAVERYGAFLELPAALGEPS